jgi:hypothetical protein
MRVKDCKPLFLIQLGVLLLLAPVSLSEMCCMYVSRLGGAKASLLARAYVLYVLCVTLIVLIEFVRTATYTSMHSYCVRVRRALEHAGN